MEKHRGCWYTFFIGGCVMGHKSSIGMVRGVPVVSGVWKTSLLPDLIWICKLGFPCLMISGHCFWGCWSSGSACQYGCGRILGKSCRAMFGFRSVFDQSAYQSELAFWMSVFLVFMAFSAFPTRICANWLKSLCTCASFVGALVFSNFIFSSCIFVVILQSKMT